MAKLEVINWKKESVGEIDLSDAIAETPYYPHLIKDSVVCYLASKRQGTASTKTRSEVSASNRKPWKQKGNGRARAGRASSPIWRKGGVVFGPKPRDFSKSINKKVLKKALSSALAEKFRADNLIVLDQAELESHKTKKFCSILEKLNCERTLIVTHDTHPKLRMASKNLQKVEVINHRSLNVYRLLKYSTIIFEKDVIPVLESRLKI